MKQTLWGTILFFFLLLPGLLLFSCGSDEPVSMPAAAVTRPPTNEPTATATATAIPPTATATAVPPMKTPEPEPTVTETLTPTSVPVATRTAIPPTETIAPSPSPTGQTDLGPVLEWVLPKETPLTLLSFSGGSMDGFVAEGELAYAFLGESLAVIDMSKGPYGEETYRLSLPDISWNFVRSGRFLFAYMPSRIVSVIDLSDPLKPSEVARIKGLGPGQLHLGENDQVYFHTNENRWWKLDVDQVLPAERQSGKPQLKSLDFDDSDFYDQIFRPNEALLLQQLDQLNPGATHWFPSQVQRMGNDYIYWTPTRGESGGGQLVRVDVSDPENVTVKSIYRSFTTQNIHYTDGFIYSAFSNELSGGSSLIDVRDPVNPRMIEILPYAANAHIVEENYLLAGNFPGLNVYDLANNFELVSEVRVNNERAQYPFLAQIVTDLERNLMLGLTGIYAERGGVVVYAIDNPANPMTLSFIFAQEPTEIKYAAGRLYIYRTNSIGTISIITVYDLSDPANPEELMTWSTEEQLIGLEVWQDGSGRHIVAALTPDEMSLWDASDPAADFQLLGKLFAAPACKVEPDLEYYRRTAIAGDWLFAPLGRCDTNRIDISDPTNPVILDTLNGNGQMVFEDGLLFMGGRNLRIYQFGE
ncbi:MAG: hypothetical protein AAF902_24955 [Chloroflexota bacterium]